MRTYRATNSGVAAPQRDVHAGFTLIEVTLAMAVVAMLAVLALPYVRSNANAVLLKSKAAEVVALLRADRNRALRSASTTRIQIDARNGLIRSEISGSAIEIPAGIIMRVSADAANGIAFDDQGRSSGGRIMLAANDVAYAVDVNRITAAIQIAELPR